MAFQDDVLAVTPTGGTTPGLVAYWPAQEASSATHLTDVSSYARVATPVNAANIAFGVDAGALEGIPGEKAVLIFDTDGYLTVSNTTDWPAGAAPWTAMAVFRTIGDGGGDGYATIGWGDYSTSAGSSILFAQDTYSARHSFWGEATQTAHVFDGVNHWAIHFWRFDGTRRQGFVQGLKASDGVPGLTPALLATGIHLGSANGNTSRMHGYMAHLAVWRGVLSDADITDLSISFINRVRPATTVGSTALDTAIVARTRLADWDCNVPAGRAYIRDTAGDQTMVLSRTGEDCHHNVSPFVGQTSVMLDTTDGAAMGPFVPDAGFIPSAGPLSVLAVTRSRSAGDAGQISWGYPGGTGTEDRFLLMLLGSGAQRLDFDSEVIDHSWPRAAGSSLNVGWNMVLFSLAADHTFALWLDNVKFTGTLAAAPAWPSSRLLIGNRDGALADLFVQRLSILGQTLSDADAAALYTAYTSLWKPVPNAPTGLSAASVPGVGVRLTWTAPATGSVPDSYTILRSTSTGTEVLYHAGVPNDVFTYDDTSVTSGTLYYYKVLGTISPAGDGAASGEASALGPVAPGAPSGLTSVSNTAHAGIDLSWTAPSTGGTVATYTLRKSTTTGTEVDYITGIVGLTYTDTSGLPGRTYFYKVAAVNAVGTGPASGEASATFPLQRTCRINLPRWIDGSSTPLPGVRHSWQYQSRGRAIFTGGDLEALTGRVMYVTTDTNGDSHLDAVAPLDCTPNDITILLTLDVDGVRLTSESFSFAWSATTREWVDVLASAGLLPTVQMFVANIGPDGAAAPGSTVTIVLSGPSNVAGTGFTLRAGVQAVPSAQGNGLLIANLVPTSKLDAGRNYVILVDNVPYYRRVPDQSEIDADGRLSYLLNPALAYLVTAADAQIAGLKNLTHSDLVPPIPGDPYPAAASAEQDVANLVHRAVGGDGKPTVLYPPTAPNAKDDEFCDATGQSGPVNGLAVKWSKHNLGTSGWLVLSDAQAPGALLFTVPTGQPADQILTQPVPAGDFALMARVTPLLNGDRHMWALLIVDSSGNGVGFATDSGGNFLLRTVASWVQTATAVSDTGVASTRSPVNLWIRKIGTTYTAAVGQSDRMRAFPGVQATLTQGFTPAFIGFGRIMGTGVGAAVLELFRVS